MNSKSYIIHTTLDYDCYLSAPGDDDESAGVSAPVLSPPGDESDGNQQRAL